MTTMATSQQLVRNRGPSTRSNGLFAVRSVAVGIARMLSMSISTAYAAPVGTWGHGGGGEPDGEGASLVSLYIASLVLVLSGGAFAGLTIA